MNLDLEQINTPAASEVGCEIELEYNGRPCGVSPAQTSRAMDDSIWSYYAITGWSFTRRTPEL